MNPQADPRWNEIREMTSNDVWSELHKRELMLASNWPSLNPSVRAWLIRQQVKRLGEKMRTRFVKAIQTVLGEPQTGKSETIFAYLDAEPDLQGKAALWAHETLFPAAEPERPKKGRRKQ